MAYRPKKIIALKRFSAHSLISGSNELNSDVAVLTLRKRPFRSLTLVLNVSNALRISIFFS